MLVRRNDRWVLLLCAIFGLLAASPLCAAAPAPSVVKLAKVDVYETMSADSGVVGELKKGDQVVVGLEMQTAGEDWCEVSDPAKGVRLGYMPCSSLRRPAISAARRQAAAGGTSGVVAVLLGKARVPLAAPRPAAMQQTTPPASGDRRFITAEVHAPDFSLKGLDGGTHSLSGLRGHYVLLDFWASWCGPCRDEMPRLDQLQKEYSGSGLEIVGIDAGETPDRVQRFIAQTGHSYTILLDPQDQASARYDVRALPTLVVIDPDGKVRFYDAGDYSSGALRAVLARVGLR